MPAATVLNRISGQVINSVTKIADFGHKYGNGFGKWAAHPDPALLGVPPSGPQHSKVGERSTAGTVRQEG